MHALLLTFALVSRALPGQALLDRPVFQPQSIVLPATTLMMNQQTTPQPPPPQINVEVKQGGRAWYVSPVWMAIGGLALVVIILMIVMAARGGGGGTTVVRG